MANVIMIDYFNPFARLKPVPVNSPVGTAGSKSVGDEVKYKQLDLSSEKGSGNNPGKNGMIPEGADGREVLIAPLTEDLNLNIETSYKTPGSLIPPSIGKIVELMGLMKTAGGATSRNPNILDVLDVPIWEKTEPLKFDVKLQFFLDTNSYNDVIRPTVGLASLCMLSPRNFTQSEQSAFLLPGINFSNLTGVLEKLSVTNRGEKREDFQINHNDPSMAKVISIEIPGVIYLPVALVEKAVPTFSKEITESGFPLWAEIQLTIMSLRSANTDMFVPGINTKMAAGIAKAAANYQASLQTDSVLGSGQRSGAI